MVTLAMDWRGSAGYGNRCSKRSGTSGGPKRITRADGPLPLVDCHGSVVGSLDCGELSQKAPHNVIDMT